MKLQWNWGVGVGAVYAAFAIATSGMVAFSMRDHVDLVSDDYYEQAISLDARRAAEARAAALGDTLAMTESDDGQQITIQWPDALTIETGTVRLYRPSNAAADQSVTIALDAWHRQSLPLGGLAAGRWVVQLDWRSAGAQYYAERALTIRHPGAR